MSAGLLGLQAAILARISDQVAGLATCKPYAGEFGAEGAARVSVRAPAVLVAYLGSTRAESLGDTRRARKTRWVAFVLDAAPDARRGNNAIGLADAVDAAVDTQRFGVPAERAQVERTENHYSAALDKLGLALWTVTWSQVVYLGESCWTDEGVTPRNVWLGIDPDPTYELIYGDAIDQPHVPPAGMALYQATPCPVDAPTGHVVGMLYATTPGITGWRLVSLEHPGVYAVAEDGTVTVADGDLLAATGGDAAQICTVEASSGPHTAYAALTIQVGGEGAEAPAGPPAMPAAGYVGGFDAGASAADDMTAISSLPDTVQGDGEWFQHNPARQPLLVHDQIGGRAVARFSGIDDALRSSPLAALRITDGVVSVVLRTAAPGVSWRGLAVLTGGPAAYAGSQGHDGQPSVYVAGTGGSFACGTSIADGQPHIVQFVFAAAGGSHIRIDGQQVGGTFAYSAAALADAWIIGANSLAESGQFFGGDIGQLAIHGGTDIDVAGIHTHLAARWGLA